MTCIKKSSLVLAALLVGVAFGPTSAVAQTAPGSVADGAACTADADCATSGATCTAPATPPGAAKVCTPPAPAPAAKKSDGEACAADGECDSGFCSGTPAVCSAQGDNGAACSRNEGCSSGACWKGKCEECVTDADCAGTHDKCISNRCVVPAGSVADGDVCTDDKECASGTCKDDGQGTMKCQPKAAPAPIQPQPAPAPPAPGCPPGTVLAPIPGGTFACVPVIGAPPATAPVQPAPTKPAPVPAPVLEDVCASFPMSDATSQDAFDYRAGCEWFAQAQACGTAKKQFWGDCALEAHRLATGRDGARRLQSFFTKGLGLVAEKFVNRMSGRFKDAAAIAVVTGDAAALAVALKAAAQVGDLLRLGVGTVTSGSRAAPRRAPAPVPDPAPTGCTGVTCQPPAPVCPPTSHRALDGSGEWGCLQQGTGLWVPPLN